jgi:hypothetical protein
VKKFVARQTAEQSQRELHGMELFTIPPDLADQTPFEPPSGWFNTVEVIQREVGLSVDGERMWRLVRHFARASFTESMRPSAKAARVKLEEVMAVAGRLQALLIELENENPSSVAVVLRENAPEWISIEALDRTLSGLVSASAAILANFDFYTVGRPGRSPRPGFRRIVPALAELFEDAGGTASAAYSENYPAGARRWTPFVRFCWMIYQWVPGALPMSKASFGDAVHGSLEEGRIGA